MAKVYFVGAGPGDPELITLKGKRLLEEAELIIYAGSLVNKELLEYNKRGAELYNSASMNLDEIIELIKERSAKYETIVRLHTGDPSIYGAIGEQMLLLDEAGIEYEVIPGVSSFTAAAAALKKEFTLPGLSQTVICTRIEGRTPVPESESLDRLAAARASMAIFLSITMIDKVVEKLLTHYPPETPAAVVYKASWPEQKVIKTTLSSLAEEIKNNKITKTAQILVGPFLESDFEFSKLYDRTFSHEYRTAK